MRERQRSSLKRRVNCRSIAFFPRSTAADLCRVIFCRNQSTYYSRLNDALQTVSNIVDFPISVYRTHFDVTEAEKLVTSISTPLVRRATDSFCSPTTRPILPKIRRLAKKTTIVTVSTDISESHRYCYVGIDNHGAGLRQQNQCDLSQRRQDLCSNPLKKLRRNPVGFGYLTHYFRALGKICGPHFFQRH